MNAGELLQEPVTGLDHLPDSVVGLVLQHLDIQSLQAIRAVNKRFHDNVLSLHSCQGVPLAEWQLRFQRIAAVVNGSWRDRLFLSAKYRTGNEHLHRDAGKVDYSSFCVPDTNAAQDTHILVTDGYRLQLLDAQLQILQGHIPPQFQQSPHRPYNQPMVASPVPVNSIPDLSAMKLLLFQPTFNGNHHLQQFRQHPQVYGHPYWPVPSFHHTEQRLTRATKDVFMSCAHPSAMGPPHSDPPPSTPPPPPPSNTPIPPSTSSSTASTSSSTPRDTTAPLPPSSPSTAQPTVAALDTAGPSSSIPQLSVPSRRSGTPGGRAEGQPGPGQLSVRETSTTGLAVMLPRAPMWAAQQPGGGANTTTGQSRAGERAKGGVVVPRGQSYQAVPYDTQTDLTFQLLSRTLALQCPTYLDISHHSELADSDIHLVLTRCNQQLRHLVAPGTQLGPLCIMMLGTQDRLHLVSLDLSYSLYKAGSSSSASLSQQHTTSTSTQQRTPSAGPATASPSSSSSLSIPIRSLSASRHGPGQGAVQGATSAAVHPSTSSGDDSYVSPARFSRSPPTGLISGAGAWEHGLRHRHPSQLHAGGEQSSDGKSGGAQGQQVSSNGQLLTPRGDPGPSGGPGGGQGGPVAAPSLYIRLLRSALGRLTNLKELRLAGNNLTGLFEPPSSTVLTSPSKPANLGTTNCTSSSSNGNGSSGSGSGSNHIGGMARQVTASSSNSSNSSCGQQLLEAPLMATISRIRLLDVSHSSGITASQMGMLLRYGTQLEEVYAEGCTGLVGDNAAELAVQAASSSAAAGTSEHLGGSTSTTLDPTIHTTNASQSSVVLPAAGQQQQPEVCQLRRLSGGWGFSSRLIGQLCAAASVRMTALHLHVGAGVYDDTLHAIGRACPALQQLRLRMAVVTDAGIRAILTHCPTLHVLHMEQCTGPFTAALLPGQLSPDTTSPHGDNHTAGNGTNHQKPLLHRWTLSQLLISGGPCLLNDHQLRLLIGPRHHTLTHFALSHCPNLTPSTLNFLAACHSNTLRHVRLEDVGGGVVPQHLQHPHEHLPCSHDNRQYTTSNWLTGPAPSHVTALQQNYHGKETYLKSRGMSGDLEDHIHASRMSNTRQDSANQLATDAATSSPAQLLTSTKASQAGSAIASVAVRPASQQCVPGVSPAPADMQPAGRPAAPDLRGRPAAPDLRGRPAAPDLRGRPAAPDLRGRPAASVWKFRESDIVGFLTRCRGLTTLHLRHCCVLSAGFVNVAMEYCPLLDSLIVDQCDLADKGLRITRDPYAPLQQVMVARCRVIEPAVMPQLPSLEQPQQQTADPAGTSSQQPGLHMPAAAVAGTTDQQAAALPVPQREAGTGGSSGAGAAARELMQRFQQRVDSDVMVHDLLEGRTSALRM